MDKPFPADERHLGRLINVPVPGERNAGWSRGVLPPTEFTRMTVSMHFYDSMAVFERGRIPAKSSIAFGGSDHV